MRVSAKSLNFTIRSRPASARLRMDISGLVRVAAIYSVGLHDMRRCMQDFMRRYPKAKVRLEYQRPNKVYDAVYNAEVDLGIISYPLATPDIEVIPLAERADGAGVQPAAPPGRRRPRSRPSTCRARTSSPSIAT